MFDPGQVVRVTVTDARGTRRADSLADRTGRLTIPVSLGPGNPYQQYTALGTLWALAKGWGFTWPSVTARVTFETRSR
jgi:hypothetical protein